MVRPSNKLPSEEVNVVQPDETTTDSFPPTTPELYGQVLDTTNHSSVLSSSHCHPLGAQPAYASVNLSTVSDFAPFSFANGFTGTYEDGSYSRAGRLESAPSAAVSSAIRGDSSSGLPRPPYIAASQPIPDQQQAPHSPVLQSSKQSAGESFDFDLFPNSGFIESPTVAEQLSTRNDLPAASGDIAPCESSTGLSELRRVLKPDLVRNGAAPFAAPGGAPAKKTTSSTSAKGRSVTFERMSERLSPSSDQATRGEPASQTRSRNLATSSTSQASQRSRAAARDTSNEAAGAGTPHSSSRNTNATRPVSGHPPPILPPEKVFPIQIGSDLFRLSGASISSDAPSYFTQFFEDQLRENPESGGVRTLYIDRDPDTFSDVARHLQGYYVKPRDGSHFVKLFADAQFYSLPRLIDQLFESEIFIQIGERHFQIPKDIFSEPGNSPNFFSLGFAVFFSSPGEVFPGLDRRGLLRPPSITPPCVPGRSADIFAELLHLLRGYPLSIRNESHRAELLRDCRYFHLRGLEQKIIAHSITYNIAREKHEITLRLEDVKPSGVSFRPDETSEEENCAGWVYYARPFVDDESYELVIEVGGECTILDLRDMRADFHGLTKARVTSLFQVVANKMNLPTNAPLGLLVLGEVKTQASSPGMTPLSEDRVKVRFEAATSISLDGEAFEIDHDSAMGKAMLHDPGNVTTEDVDMDSQSEDESISSTRPPSQQAQRSTGPSSSTQRQTPQSARPGGQRTAAPSKAPSRPAAAQQRVPSNASISQSSGPGKKRKRPADSTAPSHEHAAPTAEFERTTIADNGTKLVGQWLIKTGQYRLRIQPCQPNNSKGGLEIVFMAVKIDAWSTERGRNQRKSFLAGA